MTPLRVLAAAALRRLRTIATSVADAKDLRALAVYTIRQVLLGATVVWLAFVAGTAWSTFRTAAGLQ